MRTTTSDKPSGIQWTLFSQLEDLDFADDLAFISSFAINTYKTQVMSINTTPTAPVTVNGEPLVQDFTYVASLISKDNGHLGKTR